MEEDKEAQQFKDGDDTVAQEVCDVGTQKSFKVTQVQWHSSL
jgi:hypothetical protein